MTFQEIQNEIIAIRFDTADLAQVKNWINARYTWIWAQADWPWKYQYQVDLSVTAGDFTPTMASDVGRVIALYDELGYPLQYLEPEEFEDRFRFDYENSVTGRPSHYTVVNRAVYLSPVPSESKTFTIDYEKRVTALSANGDTPALPSEHHYLLVVGGMAIGLKLQNDRTWEIAENEFESLYNAMVTELLPPDRAEPIQYGRDNL